MFAVSQVLYVFYNLRDNSANLDTSRRFDVATVSVFFEKILELDLSDPFHHHCRYRPYCFHWDMFPDFLC